jgi:hypothetical protein
MVSFKRKFLFLFFICAVFILVGATNMFAATTVDLGGPYDGVVGTPIDFTGTASCAAGEGNIISGLWDFGDGTGTGWIVAVGTDTETVEIASHAYEATGTYDVMLTVGCATAMNSTVTEGTDTTTATVECTPTVTCSVIDAECGLVEDDCGNLLACGTCEDGYICVDNICTPPVVCDPGTECPFELECGDIPDGCPGDGTINCGECDPADSCVDNICVPDCECDDDWKNHGQYVRCVAWAAEDLVDLGSITEDEKDEIVAEAAESDCGKK